MGESISAITGSTINPDHIAIGVSIYLFAILLVIFIFLIIFLQVSKLLHIALNSAVAHERAMPSAKCIVQFISQGQDEYKIEETGAESVNNEVEVLFPGNHL